MSEPKKIEPGDLVVLRESRGRVWFETVTPEQAKTEKAMVHRFGGLDENGSPIFEEIPPEVSR